MYVTTNLHLSAETRIEAKASNGVAWVKVGAAAIFAEPDTFIRLRDAIDAYLIANPAQVQAEAA